MVDNPGDIDPLALVRSPEIDATTSTQSLRPLPVMHGHNVLPVGEASPCRRPDQLVGASSTSARRADVSLYNRPQWPHAGAALSTPQSAVRCTHK